MRLPQTGAAFEPGSPPRDRGQAITVLRTAVELGVNHIDTAAFYFSSLRSANELINSALSPYPEDLVIATKVGPSRDPSGAWRDPAGPGELRGQVAENLRQLGRDHLDLVYLRAEGPGDITDRFAALAELRQAGLIRHLGISAVGPHQLAQAQAVAPVVAVQNSYGLGYRPEQDEFVRLCGEQGVAFVPFFSIAGANREAGGSGTDSRRSGSRGHSRVARTCSSSRAPAIPSTSRRTSPRVTCGCPTRNWPASTRCTTHDRRMTVTVRRAGPAPPAARRAAPTTPRSRCAAT